MDAFDIAAMRACLDLATLGPAADPNPRVGCVVTSADGAIAGGGYHRGSGTAHAEVAALSDAAANGSDVRGGTAYVSLEPCAHTGRTGPCADALVAAGVTRVVVLRRDPGDQSGGGAARLTEAGAAVDVLPDLLAAAAARATGTVIGPARDSARAAAIDATDLPVLSAIAERAAEIVEPWECATRHGRPFVTWKYAATLDGRSAARDGSSRWITGEAARADVHARRATAGAVVVGTGTVLADDPALTVRDATDAPVAVQPLRVVVGERYLPATAQVFASSGATGAADPALHLRTRDVHEVLAALHDRRIRHVWLEGGPSLAAAFLAAGLVDEIVGYVAPALLGAGPTAIGDLGIDSIGGIARFDMRSVDRVGDDVRLVLRPARAATPDTQSPPGNGDHSNRENHPERQEH